MLNQPIEAIDFAILEQLVSNQVSERRDLEFKRDLPGRRDDDVKEFLADVTSLANAQGGDLIFGIEDTNGTASGLPGVLVDDVDGCILRLENTVRDGVEPRITGLRSHWVPLPGGTGALVMRLPASVSAPHRLTFRNSGRFYNRTSRGKYEMDVHELRHAFTDAAVAPQRFRHLHDRAIELARGVDMPISMPDEPTAVVSVVPLSVFRQERDISITRDLAIVPVKADGYSAVDMIEGVLMHSPVNRDTGGVRSWAITYRSGRVDVSWTVGGLREDDRGGHNHLVFAPRFEEGLLEASRAAQSKLRHFGLEGPWIIMATIYGVQGYFMNLGDFWESSAAFRDEALLGELRIEDISESTLLPILKNFWLLFGQHRPEDRAVGRQ